VLAVIVLIVVVVVALATAAVMWTRRAAACAREIGAPADEPERMLYGDVLCRSVMTSGSFARLEIHDWGVRLRGIPLTRWIVPTWEARYEELAIAEVVESRSRRGVWLRLKAGAGGIGFLTSNGEEAARALEAHGVQVDRSVTPFRQVIGLS
jgi:hypothetical protein